ncbi:MAG: hypothetical protein ABI645_00990 [Pseudomonadota bacterium]
MNYLFGTLLALPAMVVAYRLRPSIQKWFYSVMVVVTASFYVLFAARSDDARAMLLEGGVAVAFIAVAILSLRWGSWLVVFAMAAHAVFDVLHPLAIANPGVPSWWGGFCWTFDVAVAALLALVIWGRGTPTQRFGPRTAQ